MYFYFSTACTFGAFICIMCVCVCVCVFVCYVHMCVHVYVCMHVYMDVCMHVRLVHSRLAAQLTLLAGHRNRWYQCSE